MRTDEHLQYMSRFSGQREAVRIVSDLLTRIPLQDNGVTRAQLSRIGRPRQNLADRGCVKVGRHRYEDIEMLLACTDGFCSTIVRLAWARDICAR